MSESKTKTSMALSEDERLLFEQLLAEEEGLELEAREAIPRREPGVEVPLSFAQQRLWFLHQLEPESPAYNIPFALELVGALDTEALERTFAEIVRRHEALRSRYPTVDGRPTVAIDPVNGESEPPSDLVRRVDLKDSAGDDPREELLRLAREELSRPFDLGRGPLLRVVLVELGPERHALFVTLHHIVSDGWSVGVLVREVAALYPAFAAGRPSPLGELEIQYADFALWQRSWLSGEVLEKQLAYWRGELEGTPVLELPTDRPRGSVQSFRGARRAGPPVSAEASAALGRVAKVHGGGSLFAVALAAFEAQLHRLTGQEDFAVGSLVANRRRSELEGLIGFFVNTLVLRAAPTGRTSFAERVRSASERVLEAHDHQDLPFEMLVDELDLARDLSLTPLFQVMIAYEAASAPGDRLELPGLEIRPLPVADETAKFDLVLHVADTGRGLGLSAEFRTDLFDPSTMRRWLGHLRNLLEGAARAPETALAELPLLSPAERHEVAVEWAGGLAEAPVPACLHQLFEARAGERPEAPALTWEGESLSYGELEERSRRLAGRLQSLGVGPEVRVALLLERSSDQVVAILATLRAGGVYVPLDPEHPEERLSFVLEETAAPVVLVTPETVGKVPSGVKIEAVDVAAVDEETDFKPPALAPENAAYVIYTSGSTGRPKGVVVGHGNAVRLFTATDDWFGFRSDDVWTLFHSYAFDFSVWELWGALAYGGRLVVVPYLTSRDPAAFRELVETEGVSVLNQTPSAFRQFIAADGAAPGEYALRHVVFGGEALEPESLRPWFEKHGDERPRLVNMYGITETTVHVTHRPLSRVDLEAGRGSRIGEPIPDLSLRVLDPRLEPQGVGVPGELHVGGAGLARGYLGRPALTARRFVPDADSRWSGARLYRSGDLARFRADGDVEYLGRIDHQVKVRGFRIETGEIEATLVRHPGVSAAVVLAEGGEAPRLVAHVVGEGGEVPAVEELRAHLASSLPEYMVPALFVAHDELPLTRNGKVDRAELARRALPELERPALAAEYVAPRSREEKILAEIWAEVLGVERVGAHDNFFALGGDSIRTVQVVAAVREEGLELSLQELFQHQTLEGAAAAARSAGAEEWLPLEPFALISAEDRECLPEGVEDAYPLTRLQAGMLFHMQLADRDYPLYHNVDSVHLRAPFAPELFRRALEEVARRHPVMRTAFEFEGYAEPLQLVYREVAWDLGLCDLRHLGADAQEAEVAAYVDRQARTPFDLARPPMLRFFLHRRSEEEFQLTVTENHAIFDGWSLNSTLTEIFHHYLALVDGSEPPLGDVPAFAFRDFVAAERRALESEEAWDFWRQQLAGAELLELPRWTLPEARPHSGPHQKHSSWSLGPELQGRLESLARDLEVPVKSVLLAAHVEVLGRAAGTVDVMTGMVSHGRPEVVGGEKIRGLFLNTLPVRQRLGRGSWRELVCETFETERSILPHRRFPMAAIQQLVGGGELFETMFNYIDFHVVQSLNETGKMESLGWQAVEQTNFTLATHAHRALGRSELSLALQYDARALPPAQVETLLGLYRRVIEAMVDDPEAPRHEDPLLSPAQRHQVMVEWNAGAAPLPEVPTVDAHLWAQAERSPEAVAITFEGSSLSFGELARRAEALAAYLAGKGIGPEDRVGLALERSPEMMIALWAVFRAGGAYVPLDPELPAERLAFMIEDSGARIVLTTSKLAERLGGLGAEVVPADEIFEDVEFPAPPPRGERAPYLIYTSGSTGRPKGVVGRHRGVINRLLWGQRTFPLGPGDTVLQKTPTSFDVSVWELFRPSMVGARLVLARPAGHRDPSYLAKVLANERVTLCHFVPSMLRAFLEEGELAGLESLGRVLASGEALAADLRDAFFARLPWAELHDLYGPTEASVEVSWHACRPGGAKRVPIGRPIENVALRVLDRSGSPVPVGVPGELHLGGIALARGYHRRPGLTSERFVPDAYSGMSGARLYRSGDLARHRFDGQVEYLGRLDHQVKLRGQRIELGEIETRLAEHPAVASAVAIVRGEGAKARLVAFHVSPAETAPPAPETLRTFLREALPEAMVPSVWVALEEWPLLPSGKLDRKALARRPLDEEGRPGGEFVAPRSELEREIAEVWCEVLEVEKVGAHDNFFDLGGHSLLVLRVRAQLNEALGREIETIEFFRHPTVADLAEFLHRGGVGVDSAAPGRLRASARREARSSFEESVAIVGMSARYPGARNVEEFWRNLSDGVESVRFYSPEELRAAGIAPRVFEQPDYVPADGFLDDFDLFDAALFGLSPREAQVTDPQHRLLLECAWQALENAGCDPASFGGAIGVFAGASTNAYRLNLMTNPELVAAVGAFQTAIGNNSDFLTTRLSYRLGLEGPSFNVQSACSTSLVATHLACQSLLDSECDLALAGGATVTSFGPTGYVYSPEGILSPDGHCRTFDAQAKGSIGGNGVGLVVLKRLSDALEDGDRIRAVIRGSAINNDGAFKVGFTAPSVEGQTRAIAEALEVAGIEPRDVGYVETHGTATPLGDPIEVTALKRVFGQGGEERCALGSVKTNIGHTDAAAGVAGLIKAALSLERGAIPPSLHYESPNPELGLEESPFYVASERIDWPRDPERPRRAGVSSFGIGGTNAHVVLEEAPEMPPSEPSSRRRQLLVFSAATASALDAATERLAAHLAGPVDLDPADLDPADLAHTLQVGRHRLEHRRVLVFRDAADAAEALAKRDPARLLGGVEEHQRRPVAWLLPGLGDQSVHMARELYETEPTFRATIERAAEILEPHLGLDLREVLYPSDEAPPERGGTLDLKRLMGRERAPETPAEQRLARTSVAQPALFAVEVALARLWREWGIEPEALIGYSLGEYTAAHLAGVFSFEDALELVAGRAKLIEELPEGAMLAVSLPEDELKELLGEELGLAAINAPQVSVASGPLDAVAALEAELDGRGVAHQRLRTRHAFHSAMMEPVLERFAELVRGAELSPPTVPLLSNVTGTWLGAEEATDPDYWARHLRGTVRFADGVAELLSSGDRLMLEVGPGRALSTAVRQHPARTDRHAVVASLGDSRDPETDGELLLGALGRLWLAGAAVDWRGHQRHARRRRVELPGYPFERQRFFVEMGELGPAEGRGLALPRSGEPADWFYAPVWKSAELPAPGEPPEGPYLLYVDGPSTDKAGLGEALAERLRELGHDVIEVTPGEGFEATEKGFQLDPGSRADVGRLIEALHDAGRLPRVVAHLWAAAGPVPSSAAEAGAALERHFYSLLFLAQALGEAGAAEAPRLLVVTSLAHALESGETVVPERAAALGPARVIPQEFGVLGHAVDVEPPRNGGELDETLDRLLEELALERRELAVAYRRGRRFTQGFEKLRLEPRPRRVPRLREGGVYLIVGGLGGIGLALARDLAAAHGAKLALTARTPLPPRESWAELLAEIDGDDPRAKKIRAVEELEEADAEVSTLAADAADPEAMGRVVEEIRGRFGRIDGVIHSAGVAGIGMSQFKTREMAEPVLAAKVQGLRALEMAFDGEWPELVVLLSSIASFTGGLGQIDYTAANAVLDAWSYHHPHNRNGEGFAATINYGLWREAGLALSVDLPEPYKSEHDEAVKDGMTSAEGVAAFHRVLERSLGQVAFAPIDLPRTVESSLHLSAARAGAVEGRSPGQNHPRPELATEYVAPESETEREVAVLWQDLLGLETVGVHDNFFELGGDSLLGTQLIARVRQHFGVELPMTVFFETPTVARMAEAVAGEESRGEKLSEIEEALAQVKALKASGGVEDELRRRLGETSDPDIPRDDVLRNDGADKT